MTSFYDYLQKRLASGGFTTEDALSCFLPLVRQAVTAHQAGLVAPLEGLNDLHVENGKIWFEEARRQPPRSQARLIRQFAQPSARALDVIGELQMSANVDGGEETLVSLQIGTRGENITRPLYLSGYVSWEHEIGHHDALTDVFSLGLILASLVCGLDLNEPSDLAAFVRHRTNLFDLNANLHPVLAKAIVRMTHLARHQRPQDLAGLLRTLENYRDQDIDFDFDLARLPEWKSADPQGRRGLILSRLQQRLFEISRRNRLLHFRPTMHTVNLTLASVPLSFDPQNIRPEQILTWNATLQQAIASGAPISLNRHLRFEEAVYLPSLLDQIRNEANRDQAEFGFAQLRMVLCFLRWSNLKEKPPERFDSPLVLLPVRLTRTKGVRDVYALEPQGTEAEINPVLRHHVKQLYAIELPEQIDLASTTLDALHELLATRIQASEPAVTVEKIERPRIQLIHARAQRRLEQYQRRVRLSGRGIRSFLDVDYSYDADNFHPLGLRLFQTRIRPPETQLRTIVAEKPRPRRFMLPSVEAPAAEKERLLYSLAEEETNPYHWEFDLCNVTLGNFRYRKMSLVRDYTALQENGSWPAGLDALFTLEPRPPQPARAQPPDLEDSHPIVPWDPTQASAIAFARTGQSHIIQGPPGTGKSQTITNLIADFVVQGKRVLFVCEKRAAIDVVYHRLRQVGLHQLCCLIHDSQADKKDFVMDLKQTAERFLNSAAGEDVPAEQRKKVLSAMKQDLAPLQRFQQAMSTAPPEGGLPLRRLLHRAVELGEHVPELAPAQSERLPFYVLWHEQRERIDRLAGLLQEQQPDMLLAQHPLRNLSSRIAGQDRPIEFVTGRLQEMQALLESVSTQFPALEQAEHGPLNIMLAMVRFAAEVRFLAEHRHLVLLRADSELSKELGDHQREYEAKGKELKRTQQATKNWREKLPADEVKIALDQARSFESRFFAFLTPAWWRLWSTMRRCYDFRAHTVKPSWTHVLKALDREHEASGNVDTVEAKARARFGFAGSLAAFVEKVTALRQGLTRLPAPVQAFFRRMLATDKGHELVVHLAGLQPVIEQLTAALPDLLENGLDLDFDQLHDELSSIEESLDELADFIPCLTELSRLPPPLAELLRRVPQPGPRLEAVVARRTLEALFRRDRGVGRFTATVQKRHVRRLEEAHDSLHEVNAGVVLDSVRRRFLENVRLASLPHGQLTAEQKEFKVAYNRGRRELDHEFAKTMRYKSIRDLAAGESGLVIRDLKPVWLMSPLSVSDTLPLDANPFDVVIFDEASQVPLEEAVPALFRAGQAIVVGDEMQLPPTAFFATRQQDDEEALLLEDDAGGSVEYDLSGNSFLNHAARSLPATLLGWHYRSRSESLISFSNRAFYDGRLLSVPDVALPAPNLGEIRVRNPEEGHGNVDALLARPVSFHFMEGGLYQQRRNAVEADYIAHLVRGLLQRETGASIGIIAFSEAQQGEIEGALRRLADTDRDFRDRLDAELEREQDGQFVGLLVKNLENIQGDERDVVILSVCYGRGPNGKMLMNFGPINQAGGERRLNVAFSRARHHMVLVTSIGDQDITNDYNDGARCLKNYLRYAQAVSAGDQAAVRRVLWDLAYREETTDTDAPADAVVTELADALRHRGYLVDLAVGHSSFRCDVAIRRPDDRAYRLGILVDTDAYYLGTNLLERDVLKPKLLRAFGWKVAHVLTKDWYENRRGVLDWLERAASGDAVPEEEDDTVSANESREPQVAPPPAAPAPLDSLPGPSPGSTRRFEFTSGTSRKFWEISVQANQHTVRFGRIGSEGQTKTRTFADAEAAQRDAQRLVQEKLAKGYSEKEG
jgi:predicted DNA-binding WGR domain protein